MISVEDLVSLYNQRRKDQGPVLARMREVRDAYNGDMVIPLPDMDSAEKPMVANLIVTGLDQTAMRIASTKPDVIYPSVRPGMKEHDERARTRRMATLGWYQQNRLHLKQRRRARYLQGYATCPVVIRPNFQWGMPEWHVRDPLSTFPAPSRDPDELTPQDCIFGYIRTVGWLHGMYPEAVGRLGFKSDTPRDTKIEVIEYVDGQEIVLAATATKAGATEYGIENLWAETAKPVILQRVKNRAGVCTAVVPGRITLDRPQGQFDQMLGMYQLQSKLMSLEVIAVEKGIFPDLALIGRAGENPVIVNGNWKDGRTGEINIVKGGDIREFALNPGFQTMPIIDRIERSQRVTAGVPSEFGGESGSNIRTGKRGDAVLAGVIDFPIQEAQELLAESLQEENKRAVAVARGYFNGEKRTFYVNVSGVKRAKGEVTYTPAVDFDSDRNTVRYAQAGSDANALVIGVGQRIGLGTLSKRGGMELDPLVDDPELEHGRVIVEGLEMAMLSGLQTQASSGQIPPADLARIMHLVQMENMPLAEAVQKVQEEAQTRQASSGAPGTPEGPVDPLAPEAQPGLAQPGMGAEAGTAPSGASVGDLSQMLFQLRSGQAMGPAERGAA